MKVYGDTQSLKSAKTQTSQVIEGNNSFAKTLDFGLFLETQCAFSV